MNAAVAKAAISSNVKLSNTARYSDNLDFVAVVDDPSELTDRARISPIKRTPTISTTPIIIRKNE
jgi:hypothetical protein